MPAMTMAFAVRSADVLASAVGLGLPEGRRELTLARRAGVLGAAGPPLAGANVLAHVRLGVDDEPIEMHFVLPLAAGATGAAGVALTGCVPADAGPGAH